MATPFVMIDLDKPRKLRFTMGAMVEFEQLTGLAILRDGIPQSVDNYSKALWVMLRQEDPELTMEQLMKIIDEHTNGIFDVVKKIDEAMAAGINTTGKAKNA